MAKKKKKKSSPGHAVKQDIAEEILALDAIYASDFALHDDGLGFSLLVVPHPGYGGENHCSVELHVRCAVTAAAAALAARPAAAGLSAVWITLFRQLFVQPAQHNINRRASIDSMACCRVPSPTAACVHTGTQRATLPPHCSSSCATKWA
jgi:hypothetical protein